jgi:signal transduction histidine kinase
VTATDAPRPSRHRIPRLNGRALRAVVLGLLLVAAIGFVDLVTGPEFGFAFFYFIPIIPVAWLIGFWPGFIVAVASASMWFFADAALKPDQVMAAVAWNAVSRLAIFVGGAYLLDRVRVDRARMHAIDRQRTEFLRILEHELPVPAQEMIEALNAAQARGGLTVHDIQALRQQAESLQFLTEEFVALGQAQSDRLQLRIVPVDIAQLVTELARQRPDQGSVLVTVPEGLVVMADPDRLRQALANTISEVVKDAGALDYVSINVRARDGDAIVAISAALPAAATRHVEDAQLRISLRLARLLVEAMGGDMSVERAALGKGTRVTLRMPTEARSMATALEAAPARRPR